MQIYVACLASYNNGVLHGRWIPASSDTDEMQAEISEILRASRFPNVRVECPDCEGLGCTTCHDTGEVPSAEEWAIHDYDGLPRHFGEYTSLDEIAAFVELTEQHDEISPDSLQAIVANFHSVDEASSALDNRFCGIYSSLREYSDEIADQLIDEAEGANEILARYFDYESYARDLEHELDVIDLGTDGVAIFHY